MKNTTRAGRTLELRESLAELTRQIGTAPPDTLAHIFDRWSETVGDPLAAHARPERIDGDALIVTVDSPAWSSHLRNLAPEVLRKLSEGAGEGAPSRLVIRVRAAGRRPDQQP
jgi:predicted nucleic acid-binding Zn ribbon protein